MYQAVPLHTNPINIIYQPILPYTDLVPPNANQYSLILTQHRQLLTCTAFYWPSTVTYQTVPLHTDPVPPSTNQYHPILAQYRQYYDMSKYSNVRFSLVDLRWAQLYVSLVWPFISYERWIQRTKNAKNVNISTGVLYAWAKLAYKMPKIGVKTTKIDVQSSALSLCTCENSLLRFFGFGFSSDNPCIESVQWIQYMGGLKWKQCYQ